MRHVLKHRVRSAVIVTLKSSASFRGVLFDHDSEALVLRNVEALDDGTIRGGRSTPLDGELIVLMADVLFLQMVG